MRTASAGKRSAMDPTRAWVACSAADVCMMPPERKESNTGGGRVERLFIAQRHYWIYAHGTTGRNVARRHADSDKQERNAGKRQKIDRWDAIQHVPDESRKCQ